jgi:SHS2 domain-containing protein
VRQGWRFLPHTADIAVAVEARSLPRLFEHSAAALFDLVTDSSVVVPKRTLRFAARGQSLEDLLVRFLSELLYLQEVKGWRFRCCTVQKLDRTGLEVRGEAEGEPFDPQRHPRRREVKAITYHQIGVRREAGRWHVTFVVDV